MDWQKKTLVFAVWGLVHACLVGCSGAPSSGEIEESVRTSVNEANEQTRQFAGALFSEDMLSQLHQVKKIGCVKAQASMGYDCDIELDMTTSTSVRRKSIVPPRFVNTDDGWRAMQ